METQKENILISITLSTMPLAKASKQNVMTINLVLAF